MYSSNPTTLSDNGEIKNIQQFYKKIIKKITLESWKIKFLFKCC